MSDELTILDPMQLANLPAAVQQLNALHEQVDTCLTRAWQTGVVLGMQLDRMKEALPHGEFGKLFGGKSDTCVAFDFSIRHAQRYMTLYRECVKCAGRIGQDEAVRALVERGEVQQLQVLAPEARSMRQALLAFMKDEPQAPTFSERNMKGRVKKEVDDAALRESVTQELDALRGQLDELMDSGRFTLASVECRNGLECSLRAFVNKLREVR